ncbi:hypothetical protein PoB_001348800 [Plakobranchus ocellatus]|uniref:Uncharacterized protein n=1 Tax=Plakobranchus ocellatus TaxID=259542 RepID=A0AAV3YX74_9GAST|nr:hypothetical protein PoB_001348800 [Plakobranchus ocellatus]
MEPLSPRSGGGDPAIQRVVKCRSIDRLCPGRNDLVPIVAGPSLGPAEVTEAVSLQCAQDDVALVCGTPLSSLPSRPTLYITTGTTTTILILITLQPPRFCVTSV